MRKISRLGFALIATVSASLVTGCTSVDENKTYASGERIVEALIAGGLTCDDPSIVDNQVDWGGSGVAYEELSCATAGGDHSYAIQRYYSTSDLKRDIEWNEPCSPDTGYDDNELWVYGPNWTFSPGSYSGSSGYSAAEVQKILGGKVGTIKQLARCEGNS